MFTGSRRADGGLRWRQSGGGGISGQSTGFNGENSGLPAGTFAEVVKFGTSHASAHDEFDRLDQRRVEGEDPLDADTVGDFADGEGRLEPRSMNLDDRSLKGLDPLLVPFLDQGIDPHTVPRLEVGHFLRDEFFFEKIE